MKRDRVMMTESDTVLIGKDSNDVVGDFVGRRGRALERDSGRVTGVTRSNRTNFGLIGGRTSRSTEGSPRVLFGVEV